MIILYTTPSETRMSTGVEFNKLVLAMIKTFETKTRDEMTAANLDRCRRRFNLLKNNMGDNEPIRLSLPYFFKYRDNIISRNEEFFMTLNVRQECDVSAEDEFIFTLIDSIRTSYRTSPQKERDVIYRDVLKLLNYCIEFKLSGA